MRWRSFVALGDSFTEGLDDQYPQSEDFRGWADHVAQTLAGAAAAAGGEFRYANLAIRGKLLGGVIDDQVPVALRMRPDLVSFAAGGNDSLRPGFDAAALATRFHDVVALLRGGAGDADSGTGRSNGHRPDLILFRFMDYARFLPVSRTIRPRIEAMNAVVDEAAQRNGVYLVDLERDEEFANPRLWSEDRLHLAAAGHRRVAAHVLSALGVAHDPQWLAAPEAPVRRSWPAARVADARWAATFLVPWLTRRFRRRSSGDELSAKRPELAPWS